MSYEHTEIFRVRHCECDAYGQAHYANYLRYMQEAAFEASAAIGYDAARYEAIGRHWLAYETEIEYFCPLRYGDEVAVKTWAENFRRVHSLRRYDIFKGDKLAARAGTDWVFMDTKTLRPATIPRHVVDAYAQGKDVTSAPRRESSSPPAPPENVYALRRRVEWRDVDSAGHVNNAVYLDYVADCDVQVGRVYNWPAARMREAGCATLPRQHHIEYKTPAVLGDELEISTWISDVEKDSMARHYFIKQASDGQLVARVRAQLRWVDLETGERVSVPQAYLDDFAPIIAS